jgi:hypothetical protein
MCIWDQINGLLLLLLRENCQGMSRLLKLSTLDCIAKTFTFTFISKVLSETKKSCWGSLGLTKGLPWWDILNNWDLFTPKNYQSRLLFVSTIETSMPTSKKIFPDYFAKKQKIVFEFWKNVFKDKTWNIKHLGLVQKFIRYCYYQLNGKCLIISY